MNRAAYSILNEALLEVWVPVVGVRTIHELWTEILENFFEDLNPSWLKLIKEPLKEICRHHVFNTRIEHYFDMQPPFELNEAIVTGSWSEGLCLDTVDSPDMDIMCVLKNIRFSHEDQEDGNLLLREDTPFVHAFLPDKEERQRMWSKFFHDSYDADKQTGKRRLSPRKLKEKLQENYQKVGNLFRHISAGEEQVEEVAEGAAVIVSKPAPTISFAQIIVHHINEALGRPVKQLFDINARKDLEMAIQVVLYKLVPSSDIVLAISCGGWPSCAREWIKRERDWPDVCTVEKIAQDGFHIVPKSSPDGDFRLSFSCAETKLIETLSPLQHKVMRAFKVVVKYHQKSWSPHMKSIVTSYHLKTVAFWYFERASQESWTNETLIHHLVSLLEELANALKIQNLPMYFMPKVNLLQNVHDPEVALDLMESILKIPNDFFALSQAVKSARFSRHFKALEHEVKMLFQKLDAESARRK